MWISVIPQLLCLLLALKMTGPKVVDSDDQTNVFAHLKEAVGKFRENSKLRLLSISSIISYGVGETVYQFSAAFIALLWPVWAIGISKMMSNLCAAVGMRISGSVTKKFGAEKSLFVSSISNSAVSLVAVIFPTVVSPALMSSTSFAYGVSSISKDALLQKEFTDRSGQP